MRESRHRKNAPSGAEANGPSAEHGPQPSSPPASDPRRSFETLAEELKRIQESGIDDRDRLSFLHEISVYQEELIVQNDALIRAQSALEETRDRFVELYEFAPNGYLTLDQGGIIRQCNLTAASLLGRPKQALEGIPLLGFTIAPQRRRYAAFLIECRNSAKPEISTDLTIRTAMGVRDVQLLCRPRRHASGAREFFVSLVDVTERNLLVSQTQRAARDNASLASRLLSIQEDERQRIARDLHDDIGQQVTALRLRLEELGSLITAESTSERVARVQKMVEELDQRLHFVASEHRPFALDLGIVAAVEQFVAEWSATFAIAADFRALGIVGRFGTDVETHIYRIAQEALNNVAKHAGATRVNVLLQQTVDGAVLIVEDDGRGFDLSRTTEHQTGLGLAGMKERAHLIGGRLEVETSRGAGTSVFLHLPPPPRGR